MSERRKFWGVVLLQLAILTLMILGKLLHLTGGREVRMGTRPVDPRSLMRGDYVTLAYPISRMRVPGDARLRTGSELVRGRDVYVLLEEGADGRASPVEVSSTPYDGELQIRGEIRRISGTSAAGYDLEATYGIEAWFVEEGTGGDLEQKARQGKVVAWVSLRRGGDAMLVDVKDATP